MIVSFCDIARCRKVFKLETMGDCYVVMTGLWNAGKDHVVTIIRFAMLRHQIS